MPQRRTGPLPVRLFLRVAAVAGFLVYYRARAGSMPRKRKHKESGKQ